MAVNMKSDTSEFYPLPSLSMLYCYEMSLHICHFIFYSTILGGSFPYNRYPRSLSFFLWQPLYSFSCQYILTESNLPRDDKCPFDKASWDLGTPTLFPLKINVKNPVHSILSLHIQLLYSTLITFILYFNSIGIKNLAKDPSQLTLFCQERIFYAIDLL